MIDTFCHDNFIGEDCLVDKDIFSMLEKIGDLAEICNLQVYIVDSLRDPKKKLKGAIVKPASRSNHFVGHAVDINLFSPGIGLITHERLFKDYLLKNPKSPREVTHFMMQISKDPNIRWGGDWKDQDPVHIDDNLNRAKPNLWWEKYRDLWL